ncbi:S1C family serine protease [Lawsonibacter celer]|uniref:S1C family serine protease n=1 Tax=Lawsonibacter celer TaxID=2986526 RepID=UPI001647C2C0|nr:trypsin-like peptidase domain-containing protein [Lawsonibacter celer]
MYYSDYNRPPEEGQPIETNNFRVSDPEPPRKKKGGAAKFIAVGLVCALLGGVAGGIGSTALTGSGLFQSSTTVYEGTRPTSAVTVANVDGKTQLTPEEIYAANLESVVGINGDVTTNVWGQTVRNAVSGSGFVISADGYILTNYHVIDGVSDIKVSFADGTSYDAAVVGGEEENDIAVLKIDAAGLRPVVLGDSDILKVGEPVVAIGNPLGELTFTLTAGYVSAKDRSITMSDGTIMNMIQTDTAINSGNSGGPLFDQYGQAVGIVSAKYSGSSGSSASIEGIGFAIPINDVQSMVTSIIENGYVTGKPNVGIIMAEVSASAQRYGIPAGASVEAILEGSCAEKAGLQVGDIITAVEDSAVTSIAQLQSAVKNYQAGDTVTFTVYRDGESMELSVTLDENNQARAEAMDELYNNYTQSQQSQQQQQQGGNYYNWPFGNFFN